MSERTSAITHRWLAEPLPVDVAESLDRLAQAADVRYLAIMPDVHLAREVCIGVALATERTLYPQAVGADIGCGMAALRFEADAGLLDDESRAAQVLAGLYHRIPALKQARSAVTIELSEELQRAPLSSPHLEKLKTREGRWQFGTLGRGNHFLELQADEPNRLWLMVHSGSRAMGQAITAHHLSVAVAGRSDRHPHVGIDADSIAGRNYISDVAWADEYARQNRLAMIAATSNLLCELFGIEAMPETLIHADHNHVRRENHFGQIYWVHRKGALSAAAGEQGVIPGSMGSASFHVTGRGHPASLCSSSHGAGRALSRGEASRAIRPRQLACELRGIWFDHRQTARLCDEAPSAYKDIRAVMRAQRELTRIDRELRPLLSYKGT